MWMLEKILWGGISCLTLLGASLSCDGPPVPFPCRDLAKAPRVNSHVELWMGSQGAAMSETEEEDPTVDSGIASRVEGMRGVRASSHSRTMHWCQAHMPQGGQLDKAWMGIHQSQGSGSCSWAQREQFQCGGVDGSRADDGGVLNAPELYTYNTWRGQNGASYVICILPHTQNRTPKVGRVGCVCRRGKERREGGGGRDTKLWILLCFKTGVTGVCS